MKNCLVFLAVALIPSLALAQTTEERLSQLEIRVKALELVLALGNAKKTQSPEPAPSSSTDSPIELLDWDFPFSDRPVQSDAVQEIP